jgi:hypothetical protein
MTIFTKLTAEAWKVTQCDTFPGVSWRSALEARGGPFH